MSDWKATDGELDEALLSAQEYFRRLDPILGFRLDPLLMAPFNMFLLIIKDEFKRNALREWSGSSDKWYEIIIGVNSHVRESLTVAAYHVARISDLNAMVIHAMKDFPLRPNGGMGGGDTLIMTAEYQAFILSCRRCLDQLTWAISGFFKNEYSSFSGLEKYLSNQKKLNIYSNPLLEIYKRHKENFSGWLIDRGEETSLRNILTHKKSIRVGTLNVSSNGVLFAGFDSPLPDFRARRISDVVEALFWDLHSCVSELVEQLCKNLNEVVRQRTSA